jgi:hypothetical protein
LDESSEDPLISELLHSSHHADREGATGPVSGVL